MLTTRVILLAYLAFVLNATRCTDSASCFVKQLFDFNYPSEGVYDISLSSTFSQMNNMIRAYGDFNNDLRADLVSTANNFSIIVSIFNKNSNLYLPTYEYSPFQTCNPINYYLYDANDDGSLDITVWGSNSINNNCMYLLVQNGSGFQVAVTNTINFTTTTQPSLFEYDLPAGGGSIKTNCLLLYNSDPLNAQRFVFYFSNGGYQNLTWNQVFISGTAFSGVSFSDQHWNTFIDLTNDCYPDFVITNSQSQIEFWVYNSSSKNFFLSHLQTNSTPIVSLNIIDVNYDGSLDFILTETNQIVIYLGLNPLNIDSTFCVSNSFNFAFNWQSPIYTAQGSTFIEQNLQFADINVNGYPQIIALVLQNGLTSISIYENKFETGDTFATYEIYQTAIRGNLTSNVLSVSFFDILDNGIVDIFANVQNSSGIYTLAFYNNYLYQNFFYIKAYGTNGKTTSKGAQVAGISFYWANSVGNSQKVSYCSQITQTSYNAYPMPYVLTGLGRANNYVEMFTVGRLGEQSSWSPIIPNSQLAIFSGSSPSSSWGIKIFIMPADSLVYVVIVCVVILTILGLILVIIKCRKKKTQSLPLLADI